MSTWFSMINWKPYHRHTHVVTHQGPCQRKPTVQIATRASCQGKSWKHAGLIIHGDILCPVQEPGSGDRASAKALKGERPVYAPSACSRIGHLSPLFFSHLYAPEGAPRQRGKLVGEAGSYPVRMTLSTCCELAVNHIHLPLFLLAMSPPRAADRGCTPTTHFPCRQRNWWRNLTRWTLCIFLSSASPKPLKPPSTSFDDCHLA